MNVISTGMSFRPKGEIFLPTRRFLAALGTTGGWMIARLDMGQEQPLRPIITNPGGFDHISLDYFGLMI
jgi:hypothetical protein